jgi:hypothetical protein
MQEALSLDIKQTSAWCLIDEDKERLVYTYGFIVPDGALIRVDCVGYHKTSTSLAHISGEEVKAWILNNTKR